MKHVSDPHDDRALIARVAAGDRAAGTALFDLHGDAVFRYARGCGLSAEAAEDVTQDVFLKILVRPPSYRGSGSLQGWLLRIARSRIIDDARSLRARRIREQQYAQSGAGSGPPRSEGFEASDMLSRLLEELAPDDREVIVLCTFLGLPAARTAEILGTTPGAIRVRMHRVLRGLAARYAELSNER